LLIPPVTGIVHKAKSGDTLEAISKFYNVPKSHIVKYTSLPSSELAVNQPVVIPGNVSSLMKVREDDAKQRLTAKREVLLERLEAVEGKEVLVSHSPSKLKKQSKFTFYKIKKGDTITSIAKRHGTSQRLIAQHNKLSNLHWLELGRELKIPATKDTSSLQTVAYNTQKPLKLVFSTPSSLETQATISAKSKINKASTDKLETVTSTPGKTEILAIKVNAATPMVLPRTILKSNTSIAPTQTSTLNLPPQASLPSAWDGLMQLSGSNFAETMPRQHVIEEVLNQNSTAASTSLPVETEPGTKLAAALLLSSPDQLLEQSSIGVHVAKVIPASQPAQEPSAKTLSLAAKSSAKNIVPINTSVGGAKSSLIAKVPSASKSLTELPKPTIAPTLQSLQSFDILEQYAAKQPEPATQPATEPSLELSKLAVAPTIQSFDVVEQALAQPKPLEPSQTQVEKEPAIKKSLKIAVAPSTPSLGIIEQGNSETNIPDASSVTQPAAEPSVKLPKLPKLDIALISPSSPNEAIEQQNLFKGKPTEVALLPESEARMTSLEVRRLELEVEHLNDKVKKAEIAASVRKAEAARQAEAARRVEELRRTEATKIAAANIRPSANSERSFDTGREAIANTGKASPLAPELPELVAKAYLPDSGYGISTGMVWPAEGTLTSGFGWRWGRVHQGIDIAAPTGTPILAAGSGTVDFAGWNDGGYGNMVDIRHDNGTITRYAHLSAIYIKTGQPVNQAQVIAAMGSTGFSTGPHLHFEIRPGGGRAVDPMSFFASAKR
jgi:murein DD-endopeptidase MepM/ murein hydrolase activator NlpD